MKLFYVVLFPHPGYWRHFTVVAKSATEAVNHINYEARQAYKLVQKKNDNDPHHYGVRLKHIITASRRYRRHLKARWRPGEHEPVCRVLELPGPRVYEGRLELLTMQFGHDSHVWNILPEIPPTDWTPRVDQG